MCGRGTSICRSSPVAARLFSRQVCDQSCRVDFLHFVRTSTDRRQAIGTWQKRERRPPLPALPSRQLHGTTTWPSINVRLTRENCEVPFEHMPRNDVGPARSCLKSPRRLRHLRPFSLLPPVFTIERAGRSRKPKRNSDLDTAFTFERFWQFSTGIAYVTSPQC